MMNDREAMNEFEMTARKRLVEAAQAMIDQKISFFEGARVVFELRRQVGGVRDFDPDFNAFVVIYSETDHLPYQDQRSLWNAEALVRLQPELERTETWAATFAPEACKNLVTRFFRQIS